MPVQATFADTASVSQVDFSKCETAINHGTKIGNTSSSYEDISYWSHQNAFYRLKISSLNLFNVQFVCEELSLSR